MRTLRHWSFRLLPGTCLLCEAPSGSSDICTPCENDLPWLEHTCLYCALPMTTPVAVCPNCQGRRPPFSAALCGFEYAFPVDVLIQRFKNNLHLAAGDVLGRLAVNRRRSQLANGLPDDSLVVPVPLHARRRRKRGFNQAELIASIAAETLGLKQASLVIRIKETPDQKTLDRKTRRDNLKGAFSIRSSPAGRVILLVDDVMTTGATASCITQLLLQHGARDVVFFSLARTPSAPAAAVW